MLPDLLVVLRHVIHCPLGLYPKNNYGELSNQIKINDELISVISELVGSHCPSQSSILILLELILAKIYSI